MNFWDFHWTPADKATKAGVIHVQVDMDETVTITADTYRFHPSSIEFRPTGNRRPSFTLWMKIEDNKIPADYFVLMERVSDTDKDRVKESLTQIMARDAGFVTVIAWPLNEGFVRARQAEATSLVVGGRLKNRLAPRQEMTPSLGPFLPALLGIGVPHFHTALSALLTQTGLPCAQRP